MFQNKAISKALNGIQKISTLLIWQSGYLALGCFLCNNKTTCNVLGVIILASLQLGLAPDVGSKGPPNSWKSSRV